MIERRDNDKDYSRGNCFWATRRQQARNKRNNRRVTAFNKTQCLAAWAEETGIPYGALYWRIVTAGWPAEKALTP